MDKLIRRRNKPYFNLICTGGRRAACIAAVVIILSASSLSVEAVREAVHDFFMSIFEDHTAVSVNSDTEKDYQATKKNMRSQICPTVLNYLIITGTAEQYSPLIFMEINISFSSNLFMIVIWLILITNIPSLNTTLMNQDRNILFKVPTMISVLCGIMVGISYK